MITEDIAGMHPAIMTAARFLSRRRRITGGAFFRHLKHCAITGAIIAVRTAAFLLRFLLPSIQSHGALPAAVISGIINLAAAAHYRRRRILSRRRFFRHLKHCAITGGGYIRRYHFGGGGALPAAAFLSPPPIAVIYRRHLLSAP